MSEFFSSSVSLLVDLILAKLIVQSMYVLREIYVVSRLGRSVQF